MKKFCSTILSLFFFLSIGSAQEPVFLTNPSFEGNPQFASVPGGWKNCAFNNETPPDIHPVPDAMLGMRILPADGETFLGMLSKSNSTVESIGQKLEKPLRRGTCYSFSVALAKSEQYYIIHPEKEELIRYEQPLVLRLWGGSSPCGKRSLLAVSPPIENSEWVRYTFQFSPQVDLSWISFDVYFTKGTMMAYRGNLMLDDASPFVPIECVSKAPLVDVASLDKPKYQFVKYQSPDYDLEEMHWAVGDFLVEYLNCRIVDNEQELTNLIFDNCNKLGFKFSNHDLIDRRGYAIKEVAVNVMKFKTFVLVVGIPELGEQLNKKRIRRIKRTFREIGLGPRWYRIETVPGNADHSEWLCGQREIWLKIEQLNNRS